MNTLDMPQAQALLEVYIYQEYLREDLSCKTIECALLQKIAQQD